MAKIPNTMRTILHDLSKATLTMSTTPIPTPNFSKNEHLLKVLAVAPCAGELSWPRPSNLTISVPGVDAVGTIISAPPTSPFQPGSRCYYRTTYPSPGSLREYSLATKSELALAPANLTATDAAAIPVSALTAWQALFEQWDLRIPSITSTTTTTITAPRIFINGATGSVGLWVLQLARLANLTTIATSSPDSMHLVKDLGATEILDYTTTSPATYVSADPARKFDFIFNAVSGPLTSLWPTLRKNGRLITIVPPANMDFAGYRPAPSEEQITNKQVEEGVKGEFFVMYADGGALGEISQLVEEGKCKGVVDSVSEFEEDGVRRAFERVDSGRSKGKVVVKVSDEEGEGKCC